jgi:hypothetical protein
MVQNNGPPVINSNKVLNTQPSQRSAHFLTRSKSGDFYDCTCCLPPYLFKLLSLACLPALLLSPPSLSLLASCYHLPPRRILTEKSSSSSSPIRGAISFCFLNQFKSLVNCFYSVFSTQLNLRHVRRFLKKPVASRFVSTCMALMSLCQWSSSKQPWRNSDDFTMINLMCPSAVLQLCICANRGCHGSYYVCALFILFLALIVTSPTIPCRHYLLMPNTTITSAKSQFLNVFLHPVTLLLLLPPLVSRPLSVRFWCQEIMGYFHSDLVGDTFPFGNTKKKFPLPAIYPPFFRPPPPPLLPHRLCRLL